MVLRFFLFACVFLFISCGYDRDNPHDPDGVNYIGKVSSRGNNIANYKTVQIGDQVWMAENLDYDVSGSRCYNDNLAACNKYGRLYDWATAMALPSSCNNYSSCASQISAKHKGICPSGWHIPSDADWDVLINFVGGSSTAGKYLKATSGWSSNGNGQDKYGFSALPGGYGGSSGGFYGVGYSGYWWSSSEYGSYYLAYYRDMGYSYEGVGYYYDFKDILLSVRCLQD